MNARTYDWDNVWARVSGPNGVGSSNLLDTNQAARYVNLSPSTMAKLRLSGRGAKFIKLGRKVLYRRSDLDSWLATNERLSTSDPGHME